MGKAPVSLRGIAAQIIVSCRDFHLFNKVWKYTPEQGRYIDIQFLISALKIRLDKSFCHSVLCFYIFV